MNRNYPEDDAYLRGADTRGVSLRDLSISRRMPTSENSPPRQWRVKNPHHAQSRARDGRKEADHVMSAGGHEDLRWVIALEVLS